MSRVPLTFLRLAALAIIVAIVASLVLSSEDPQTLVGTSPDSQMSSISPKFLAQIKETPSLQVATVAAGCFWGVEHIYRKYFLGKGLLATEVGYTGGDTAKPTYRQVCSSSTNHAEGLQLLFDPAKVSYESLIEFFFKIHDPTTVNQQGPDRGSQYRSAIFTHDQKQQSVAEAVRDKMQKEFWPKASIVTQITPIEQWWDAEDYHQLYLENNPSGYECPTHYLRTKPQL